MSDHDENIDTEVDQSEKNEERPQMRPRHLPSMNSGGVPEDDEGGFGNPDGTAPETPPHQPEVTSN